MEHRSRAFLESVLYAQVSWGSTLAYDLPTLVRPRRSCTCVEMEAAVHLFSQRMPEDILASAL